MKLGYQGVVYELPILDDLTTLELREIKRNTGMGLRSLYAGLEDMDTDVAVSLLCVAKQRGGEKVKFADFDNLKPYKDFEWHTDTDVDAEDVEDQSNPPTESATPSPDVGMFPSDEF